MLPRPLRRELVERALRAILLVYALVLGASTLGVVALGYATYRARRRRVPHLRRARWLLLCCSNLFVLALAEVGAATVGAWLHGMPPLPTSFEPPDGRAHLAVIGGSGALGHPYNPNVSLGQIVAGSLERALPGRRFQADVLAELGATLAEQHRKLARLKQRPAAVLIYTGHNEFTGRFEEERNVDLDEAPQSPLLHRLYRASLSSPLCRLIYEILSKNRLDGPPPLVTRHRLIDTPMFTPSEAADILDDYRRRMERIVAWCDRIGALPILVIEVGDEGGYPPNRSLLPALASAADRRWVEGQYRSARAASERSERGRAEALYRELVRRQPDFAEGHFQLARALERSGRWKEALVHYVAARDRDGMPFRCTTPFQGVSRAVAARHPRSILIDGPAELRAICAHGIVDSDVMHDGVHVSLRGMVALATAVLRELRARGELSWHSGPVPSLDPSRIASESGMNRERWLSVCEWGRTFYRWVTHFRFDPSEHIANALRFEECRQRIAAGDPPQALDFKRLSLRPVSDAEPLAVSPVPSDQFRRAGTDTAR